MSKSIYICQNPSCQIEFSSKVGTSNKYCCSNCYRLDIKRATDIRKQLISNQKDIEYLKNPTICLNCSKILSRKKKTGNFCCKSCANSLNNTKRKHTEETKILIRNSIRRYNKPILLIRNFKKYGFNITLRKYTEETKLIRNFKKYGFNITKRKQNKKIKNIKFNLQKLKTQKITTKKINLNPSIKIITYNKCIVCNQYHSSKRKTCSNKCLKVNQKINGTNNLRKRRLNGENFSFRRKSKLEVKFEQFLISKNIMLGLHGYLQEVYVKNPYNTSGYYRLDFVIPTKKLVIEVDGKQHETSNQIKHDVIRDYVLNERGWQVIRVNYYEINKPKILELIYNSYLK